MNLTLEEAWSLAWDLPPSDGGLPLLTLQEKERHLCDVLRPTPTSGLIHHSNLSPNF